MPTLEQIRAARALLGWSQHDLANKAGLSQTGIARIENGTNQPNTKTLDKIMGAFDQAGIEFILSRGVQLKENSFTTLRGQEGLEALMDDVYGCLVENGGEFCIFNADPQNWSKWMSKDKWDEHKQRMIKIRSKVKGKIIVKENNDYFLAQDYAEYRWTSANDYDPQKTMYSYADRLAFMDFRDESLTITLMKRFEFANGFRVLFDAAWDRASKVN
jgi:transcriptional regulator with XRE-family HTH domain